MREYKKVMVERRLLQRCVCNRCEKPIDETEDQTGGEVIEVRHSFGYWSNKDGEEHRWDLCETCYDEFVATFKIPPTVVPSDPEV